MDELLRITIPGVHTEQLGSKNQAWDARVRDCVRQALRERGPCNARDWYAVHVRWFVGPVHFRRDLDNFRLKPILDSLTGEGFWPDDNVTYVRRILVEAEPVGSQAEEHTEVTVHGS